MKKQYSNEDQTVIRSEIGNSPESVTITLDTHDAPPQITEVKACMCIGIIDDDTLLYFTQSHVLGKQLFSMIGNLIDQIVKLFEDDNEPIIKMLLSLAFMKAARDVAGIADETPDLMNLLSKAGKADLN